jgi:formimidoylglutamate deiminase
MSYSSTNSLFAKDALLPTGWAKNVLLTWTEGRLDPVQTDVSCPVGVTHAAGPVIPGMPNLHSHAFQRAFAGFTELRGATNDSFWSWRTLMYRFAAHLNPTQFEAIATWLYIEMLQAGYTSVCEFHYLHHDTDGLAYANDACLAEALLRAAETVGIQITLLPVLYQTSGFGATPPTEGQRRFIRSNASMLRLLENLVPQCVRQGARLGLAPHSLRAVTPDSLADILLGLDALDPSAPRHIHIAEQPAEVEASVAYSGQRPLDWLLDHVDVDSRWCLVHATHLDDDELSRAAASGAVAGLCPSTEANLGDGIFSLPAWERQRGLWGIGSDSHVCVNAAEELMLLEYSQRLATQRRNVAAPVQSAHVATAMVQAAVRGGTTASGRASSSGACGLTSGQSADFLVLDGLHLALQGVEAPDLMLAAHVFASHRSSAIADVWVKGQQRVRQGQHAMAPSAALAFVNARAQLLNA